MTRFTAAVVGLGRIGQGYDADSAGRGRVLSHAQAFREHPGYDLVAGVDPDVAARARFSDRFGRPAYAGVADMLREHRPEVAAIAVPTPLHEALLDEVLAGRPRAVLCEKPLAPDTRAAVRMRARVAAADCALMVNYLRRCDPGTASFRDALGAGAIGDVYKGVVWYTKGLLNNGSHFVDLLRWLLGEMHHAVLLAAGPALPDGDAEPDFVASFGAARVVFLAARESCFSLATMQLVGTGGTADYLDGGARIVLRTTRTDAVFSGYRSLGAAETRVEDGLQRYQWHCADALHRHLADGAALASDGVSALRTLEAVETVMTLRQDVPHAR